MRQKGGTELEIYVNFTKCSAMKGCIGKQHLKRHTTPIDQNMGDPFQSPSTSANLDMNRRKTGNTTSTPC